MNFSIDDDDNWWRRGRNPESSDDSDSDDDYYESEEDDEPVVECRNCGEEIFEEAEQCPHCGWWIVPDTSTAAGRPNWLILVGVLAAILAIGGLLMSR